MSTTRDTPEGDDRVRLVVRVWLPDRPGALGLVASRIGAIGADIVGVDVLERSDHVAVDEFAVVIPSMDLVKLLVREIEEVDGASVEQWERVDRFPDARLDALETVERVFDAADVPELWRHLVERVRAEFNADWAVVVRGASELALAGNNVPDSSVLEALASGTPVLLSDGCHLPEVETAGAGRITTRQIHAVANALVQLLSDRATLEEMGHKARSFAKRYDWREIVDRLITVYEEGIARHRRRLP